MSDVADMIAAYGRGELTLDELAQRFRDRTWISEGSFDEVAAAYLQGEISIEEYDILARAAAETGSPQG